MKRILYIFCFFLLAEIASVQGHTTVQAELLAQKETVSEGKEFFLALKMTLPRGWHVYWKNPGDAGESISLDLKLPAGFKETRRIWPAPKRFNVGPLTEYGYDREAWLLIGIRTPDRLKAGEVLEISGRAVWLACHDECVPMAQDVATLIAVKKDKEGAENAEINRIIADLPQTEQAVFFETSDSLVLSASLPDQAKTAYFFPQNPKTLIHSAPQTMKTVQGKAYVFMKKAPAEDFASFEKLEGVLVFYNVQGEQIRAFDVSAEKTLEKMPVFSKPFILSEFLTALLFAFIGGIILNLMPCVFPVLSLKAFRLLNSDSTPDSGERRKAGLSYTAGVVLSFLLTGSVLIGFRAAGTELGWGFQLQYPPFVLSLCLFMFCLGLIFSDVISVGERISAASMNLSRNWGDFGTGVLAVLAATPCAAPFMGTALGYGLMNPAAITLGVFAVMGFGLAFPFLLLDFYPSMGRFLPKSGAWTMQFRHFLAFPLYATSAWLLWVLAAQEGSSALAVGLSELIAVAFCVWVYRAVSEAEKLKKAGVIVIGLIIAAMGYGLYSLSPSYQAEKKENSIEWQTFDPHKIHEYRQVGVPVFIKFSAKWCLTCLVNEKTTFANGEVVRAFRRKGVAAFAADWTNRSDEITTALEEFGRAGVPFYVYYAPYADKPVILPQLVTDRLILPLFKDL